MPFYRLIIARVNHVHEVEDEVKLHGHLIFRAHLGIHCTLDDTGETRLIISRFFEAKLLVAASDDLDRDAIAKPIAQETLQARAPT